MLGGGLGADVTLLSLFDSALLFGVFSAVFVVVGLSSKPFDVLSTGSDLGVVESFATAGGAAKGLWN